MELFNFDKDQFLSVMELDEDFVKELCQEFKENLPIYLDKMHNLIADNQLVEAGKIVHKMRGELGNMGFSKANSIGAELEENLISLDRDNSFLIRELEESINEGLIGLEESLQNFNKNKSEKYLARDI